MKVPSYVNGLSEGMIRTVRTQSPRAEFLGTLTPQQRLLFQEQRWLTLLIPKEIGGLEYPLPTIMEAVEAASWMDGSFGWVMALCGGAGFFAGFVEKSLALSLFGHREICVAGTGYPAGLADTVPGGYSVSGHWRYASGAPHATLFTANCRIAGQENIKPMIFLPTQVRLVDGWKSIGLKATASQDMIIEEAFVPEERSFDLSVPFAHASGPLYRYPFLQQAEAILSVTLLGMTQHYLDLFALQILPKFSHRSAVIVESYWEQAVTDLSEARASVYDAVQTSWMPYLQGARASDGVLEKVGVAAVYAARQSLAISDRLYGFGGMEMMHLETEINRVWRDIHTASQHILLSPLKR